MRVLYNNETEKAAHAVLGISELRKQQEEPLAAILQGQNGATGGASPSSISYPLLWKMEWGSPNVIKIRVRVERFAPSSSPIF